MRPFLRAHKGILLFVTLYFLAQLVGLTRSPLLWLDEVTLNDPARILSEQGILRSSVFNDIPEFQRHYYWQPPVQALSQSAVYSVFGFGIWQTRITSLLFGCACVLAVYGVCRLLGSSTRSATLASVLLALDTFFIYATRNARMDTECLAFLATSFALILFAKRRAMDKLSLLSWMSGLLAGLACLTHPVALAFAFALSLVALLDRERSWRAFLSFVAGLVLTAGVWAAWISNAEGWTDFRLQFLRHGSDHVSSGGLLNKLLDELARYPVDYVTAPFIPFVLALIVLSFALLLYRSWSREHVDSQVSEGRSKEQLLSHWSALFCFLCTFVFNILFMIKSVGFYSLYPSLCLYIMLASVLSQAQESSAGRWIKVASFVLLSLYFATGLGARWFMLATQWEQRAPEQFQSQVQRIVPAGSSIYAEPALWYAALAQNSRICVEDNFTTRAYEQRKKHDYARFAYFVLEKRHQYPADADSTHYCGSIVVTAPNPLHPQKPDTLYAFDVLKSKNYVSVQP